MPDPLYTLGAEDIAVLRRLIQWWRSPNIRQYNPWKVDHEEQPSPEMHLFRTPAGGIPAKIEGDITGTGSIELQDDHMEGIECEVWRLEDIGGRITVQPVTGLTYTLFNPFDSDVPGLTFVLGWRDKFGTWWVDERGAVDEEALGTGTTEEDEPGGISPNACDLVRADPRDDCILARGPENSVDLRPGGLGWVSTDTLTYFDGTAEGTVAFWFADGQLHLSVGGLELLDCGDGCFTGGPLTGHHRPGTGSNPAGVCNGEVFTVCVSCQCCPIEGWAGPGWYCVRTGLDTGTGTTYFDCVAVELLEEDKCDESIEICSGPYDTELEAIIDCQTYPPYTGTGTSPGSLECCDPAPGDTLYAHFTGALAEMGTVQLNRSGSAPNYSWSGSSSCGGFGKTATLACNSGLYSFGVTSSDPWDMILVECEPFVMVGTTADALNCPGESQVVIDTNP